MSLSTSHTQTNGRERLARRRFRRAPLPTPAPLIVGDRPSPTVRERDRVFRAAVVAADVLAALVVVALLLAWLPTERLSWTALLLPIAVPIVHAANGLYERDTRVLNKSTLEEAPVLFRAAAMTTIVTYLIQSGILVAPIGAKVVGAVWLGLAVFIPVARVVARAVTRDRMPPERCLVVGDNEQARRVAAKLDGVGRVKSQLVGIVPLAVAGAAGGNASHRLVGRLGETVERLDVHRVVVAADAAAPQQELDAIQAAKALGVKVSVLPRVLEVVGSSATYDFIDGMTILGVPHFGLSRTAQLTKRAFDILGSTAALVLFGPLMAVIAIAIASTSRGQVLFRQARIGRGDQPFFMLKFRSMRDDAERLKDGLREHNEQDGLFKIADDPRVTRIGRILRRTSLDELPQLFNVLRGEMGLVGPRPLVPEEDARIQGWHRRRLHLTPGMTGPWQVLGSARIPLGEMVTIDYLYVANWSLWNDVKILLRTILTVLARRGC